jgi:ABC-2 type transport system ATP-binding protein
MTQAVVVKNFKKTFRIGLLGRLSPAVHDISFEVEQGEIFGFLGPNGAGKTTTIKALLGLIRPDAGELRLLGHPVSSMGWRTQVGYLPEHPNFYEYLSGFELVTWFGRLSGLTRHDAEKEAKSLLERVGLGKAMHRRLRGYSKGMLQRAGLAQALVASPKLLILDEPVTGLDPNGRKDMRELIVELRAEGRTIMYSKHMLPDVAVQCDRVAYVHQDIL